MTTLTPTQQAQQIARVVADTRYSQALAAGLNRMQAFRWVLYLEKTRQLGRQPITLAEAVAQCKEAAR